MLEIPHMTTRSSTKVAVSHFDVRGAGTVSLGCSLFSLPTPSNDKVVVLFVHQWGAMGGNGSLMQGMARKMAMKGWVAVTFDHRGVGNSTGTSTYRCHSEVADVVAVVEHLTVRMNIERVFLVGSSAGACVAGSALSLHSAIAGCGLIGYPYGWLASTIFGGHYAALLASEKPKLLVHGEGDGFTSTSQFQTLMGYLQGPTNESVLIPSVGHFEMEGPSYDTFMTDHFHTFFTKLL